MTTPLSGGRKSWYIITYFTILTLACSPFLTRFTFFQNIFFLFPSKSPIRHSFRNFNCLFHNSSMRAVPVTCIPISYLQPFLKSLLLYPLQITYPNFLLHPYFLSCNPADNVSLFLICSHSPKALLFSATAKPTSSLPFLLCQPFLLMPHTPLVNSYTISLKFSYSSTL